MQPQQLGITPVSGVDYFSGAGQQLNRARAPSNAPRTPPSQPVNPGSSDLNRAAGPELPDAGFRPTNVAAGRPLLPTVPDVYREFGDGTGEAAGGANTDSGISIGDVSSALGVADALGIGGGMLGGFGAAASSIGGISNGDFGPLGGTIGGMLGGAPGAVLGGLGGMVASGTVSPSSIGGLVGGVVGGPLGGMVGSAIGGHMGDNPNAAAVFGGPGSAMSSNSEDMSLSIGPGGNDGWGGAAMGGATGGGPGASADGTGGGIGVGSVGSSGEGEASDGLGYRDGGMIGEMPGLTMRYMNGGPVGGNPMLAMGFRDGGMPGMMQQHAGDKQNARITARAEQLLASGELTMDEVVTMARVAEAAMYNPDLYPQLRQFVAQQGMSPLPAQYDESVVQRILMVANALQRQAQEQPTMPGQVPGMDQAMMSNPTPGYGNGGMIHGPGTGRSDSIGTVNESTGQPVKVANEEYVIPAHVVRAKGREFFDNLLRRYSDLPKGE
jgi:hypothetical protein